MQPTPSRSSEEIKDSAGRQYHVATAPGEVADYVLLCGDPQRADRVAKHFSDIEVENRYREFVTITGLYKNLRITVCATGIGCDNSEIAMVELCQCVEQPTFLRIGSCGSLQKSLDIGDFAITTAAMRRENTSLHYVPESYPAVTDMQLCLQIKNTAQRLGLKHHLGITATCSSFYAAQDRSIGKLKPLNAGFWQQLAELRVMNFEMETSTIFTLASLQGLRAGSVCAVFANRTDDRFASVAQIEQAEENLVNLGLETLFEIYQQDIKTS